MYVICFPSCHALWSTKFPNPTSGPWGKKRGFVEFLEYLLLLGCDAYLYSLEGLSGDRSREETAGWSFSTVWHQIEGATEAKQREFNWIELNCRCNLCIFDIAWYGDAVITYYCPPYYYTSYCGVVLSNSRQSGYHSCTPNEAGASGSEMMTGCALKVMYVLSDKRR